jgi:lipase ATG15
MYIPPLITSLLTLSLPRRPTQVLPLDYPLADTHIRSFRPVQAHATHPESYQLLWHNASTKHNLVDPLSVEGGLSLLGPAGDAPLSIRTRKITIRRPTPSPRRTPGRIAYDTTSTRGWEDTEVEAPDVTDRETLRTLAKMTSNAYVLPESTEWWPLEDYNAVSELSASQDARLRIRKMTEDDLRFVCGTN